jgi:ATP-dependent Zn protease
MVFYVIKVLNTNIDLLRYDELNNTKYNKYNKYVDHLDLITSEPTEQYEITNCPSINKTYIPTIKVNITNTISNNTNNTTIENSNTQIVLIITTTLVSFVIIIVGFILYYLKHVRNKKEKEKPIFIYDDNFGTEFDEIVDI